MLLGPGPNFEEIQMTKKYVEFHNISNKYLVERVALFYIFENLFKYV